jgi:RimJ/RimL family protein N-acetyltransferase
MIVRPASATDVEALVDVQQAGAVRGLAHIFPQDRYPFPREVIVQRWLDEIADPDLHVYVSADESGAITGFAATASNELRHFGTAPWWWGTGLASDLHDAMLQVFAAAAVGPTIRLYVFEANARARRFYEKHDWRGTGSTRLTSFAPNPVLIEYERALNPIHQ